MAVVLELLEETLASEEVLLMSLEAILLVELTVLDVLAAMEELEELPLLLLESPQPLMTPATSAAAISETGNKRKYMRNPYMNFQDYSGEANGTQ